MRCLWNGHLWWQSSLIDRRWLTSPLHLVGYNGVIKAGVGVRDIG
jgi:hypothetical protein